MKGAGDIPTRGEASVPVVVGTSSELMDICSRLEEHSYPCEPECWMPVRRQKTAARSMPRLLTKVHLVGSDVRMIDQSTIQGLVLQSLFSKI